MLKRIKELMERFFNKQTRIAYTPESTNADDYFTSEEFDKIDDTLNSNEFYENNEEYMVDYEIVHESVLALIDKSDEVSIIINEDVEENGFLFTSTELMGANTLLGFESKVCVKFKNKPCYLIVTVGSPS